MLRCVRVCVSVCVCSCPWDLALSPSRLLSSYLLGSFTVSDRTALVCVSEARKQWRKSGVKFSSLSLSPLLHGKILAQVDEFSKSILTIPRVWIYQPLRVSNKFSTHKLIGNLNGCWGCSFVSVGVLGAWVMAMHKEREDFFFLLSLTLSSRISTLLSLPLSLALTLSRPFLYLAME